MREPEIEVRERLWVLADDVSSDVRALLFDHHEITVMHEHYEIEARVRYRTIYVVREADKPVCSGGEQRRVVLLPPDQVRAELVRLGVLEEES